MGGTITNDKAFHIRLIFSFYKAYVSVSQALSQPSLSHITGAGSYRWPQLHAANEELHGFAQDRRITLHVTIKL